MFPEVQFARTLITLARGYAAKARREGRSEVGASAIEWAIISAVVVTLALVVFRVIQGVVNDRVSQIGEGSGG